MKNTHFIQRVVISFLLVMIIVAIGSTAYATSEIESNNTLREATKVDYKTGNITGYTSSSSDKDYFILPVTTPGNLTLTSENNVSIQVDVLTATEETLASFETETDKPGASAVTVGLPKGNYYIKVTPDNSYKQNYKVALSFKASNFTEQEPNGTLRTATKMTNLNTAYTGYTQFSSDKDYYTFTVTEEGQFTLSVDNGTDVQVRLYNENEKELFWFYTDKDDIGSVKRQVGLKPGTYFLKVTADDYYRESYVLNTTFDANNYTDRELNDSFRTAKPIELNFKYDGYTQSSSDSDYYSFTLPKSQTVTIYSNHGSDNRIYLYDANNNNIEWFYTDYDSKGSAYETVSLPAGTFYVQVRADSYYALPYTISVRNSQAFKDLSYNYWATNEIMYLSSKKIINGYLDGKFHTEPAVTRQQAAMMIARAKNLNTTGLPKPTQTDISSKQTGYKEMAAVINAGLFDGIISSSKFQPTKPLTRGEMAVVITRAFDLKASSATTNLKDINSYWGKNSIIALADNDITKGYLDNTFKPNESLTRLHFSVFMARTMEKSFR